MWRYTAKRLYTGTQYVVVVTGHSNKMLSEAHMRIYKCARDYNLRLMQLFILGLHSHGMRATHLFVRNVCKVAAKKTVQGDSFWITGDAVPHWPRLDVCRPRIARNMNSRRLLCSRFTGGKIRRPSLWSKGMVSGSVLFSGRRGCIDQEDDVLFLPLPPCCSMQSHKYTRGKRKTLQSFTGQPQRHSTKQNEGNQNTVSQLHITKLQHLFRIITVRAAVYTFVQS